MAEVGALTVEEYFAKLAEDNERVVISGDLAMWQSFDSDRHPDLQKAVKVIKRWYNERLTCGGALVLAGGYGCGKTHLAKAICDMMPTKAIMFEETKLFKDIQNGYSGNGNSEYAFMRQARQAQLLIYDDLGSYETENFGWVQGIYRQLFDQRAEQGKPFLITTNLSLKTFGNNPSQFATRLGGRNFSRVMGAVDLPCYIVNLFNVPDYRLRNFLRAA